VLLHGIPGSAHTWEKAGTLLSAHYDVIIPDLRGFGGSETTAKELHLDHDFYLEAHAEAVHRLLSTLKIESFYLGGYDFGGPVALTLLQLFPDQDVHGLILSATNLFTDPDVPPPLRLAGVPVLGPAIFRLFAGTRPGLRLLYRIAAHNKAAFQKKDFAKHLTPTGRQQTWRIFHRSLSNLQETYKDVEAMLPSLDLPTLVLWGDRDPFFSVEMAKRLVNTLPRGSLSLLQNTGHFVPEERPEMVAWHVDDFLREVTKRTTGINEDRSSF
jgi:pimeloyl-ACP methyl ester carboxylesterase